MTCSAPYGRIAETEDVRNAIARMVGEVGKNRIEDILGILDTWATHEFGRIAKTAGIALQQVAMDPSSTQHALRLLHNWSIDIPPQEADEDARRKAIGRRWACAATLWRIALIESRSDLLDFALQHLEKLARDPSDYVVSSVAYALRMMVSAIPLERIVSFLSENRSEGANRRRLTTSYQRLPG